MLWIGGGAELLHVVRAAAVGEAAHATRVNPNLCILLLTVLVYVGCIFAY
jgi:hypothetical protein